MNMSAAPSGRRAIAINCSDDERSDDDDDPIDKKPFWKPIGWTQDSATGIWSDGNGWKEKRKNGVSVCVQDCLDPPISEVESDVSSSEPEEDPSEDEDELYQEADDAAAAAVADEADDAVMSEEEAEPLARKYPRKPKAAAGSSSRNPPPAAGGGRRRYASLYELLRSGLITPGEGIISVAWRGVDLSPPYANLLGNGKLTLAKSKLPNGLIIDVPDHVFSPSGLLNYLAAAHGLEGFEKGNGWEGLYYGTGKDKKKLSEIRGDPIGVSSTAYRVADSDESDDEDEILSNAGSYRSSGSVAATAALGSTTSTPRRVVPSSSLREVVGAE